MNFCTHCGSYYARPGTCNCFVRVGMSANAAGDSPLPLCPTNVNANPLPLLSWPRENVNAAAGGLTGWYFRCVT
jgi:hypothetical protein